MKRERILLTVSSLALGCITLACMNTSNASTCKSNAVGCNSNVAHVEWRTESYNQEVNLYYGVTGHMSKFVNPERIHGLESLDELIKNYPTNWITTYKSVDVTLHSDGETITISGIDEKLNSEQKELLSSVTVSDKIDFKISYRSKNAATEKLEDREMNVSYLIIPKNEASYKGGYEEMINYFKDNSYEFLSNKGIGVDGKGAIISFYVNENGNVEHVNLRESSNDQTIDDLLMELVQNMPTWNPASNENGEFVKQQFEFSIGKDRC